MEQISTFYLKFMTSASYMVKGPDKNLPFEYGHVGPDGLDQRWLNLHGSMQWYIIIKSRHVQKITRKFW